jgi:hypothetical protein
VLVLVVVLVLDLLGHTTDARAELNWSNLHAGPDFAKASSRQAAYAYAETLMPRW